MEKINPPPKAEAPVINYRTAIAGITDKKFIVSQRYKDQQLRAVRENAHPDILEFEKRFITKLRKQYIPFFCHFMWRDALTQNALYVQGRSKASAMKSAHNFGMAVDLIHSTKAWDLDTKQWEFIGHVGKELSVQAGIDVTWGGDWKTLWDPAHWELTEWKILKEQVPTQQLK